MSEPFVNSNQKAGVLDGARPEIKVGTVAIDPSGTYYAGPVPATGKIFTDYMVTHRYEHDLHRYLMPVAHPSGYRSKRAAVVQLAAPTLLWIADWTACQYNDVPSIPDPFDVPDGWVLVDLVVEPAMMTLSPDGFTPLRRISGTYVFVNNDAGSCESYTNSVLATAQFPLAPWVQGGVLTRKIPAGALMGSIMNDNGGGGNLRAAPGVPFVGRRN